MLRRLAVICTLALSLLLVSGIAAAKTTSLEASAVDDIAGAAKVFANRSYLVKSAAQATRAPGEPAHTCRAGAGGSVWFAFTTDRLMTVTFQTIGTDYDYPAANSAFDADTVMSLYYLPQDQPASYAGLTNILCNDDIQSGVRESMITTQVAPSFTYFLQVSTFLANPQPGPAGFVNLNIFATNFITTTMLNGTMIDNPATAFAPWKLSGSGLSDDTMVPDGNYLGATLSINHSSAGPTKLKQVVSVPPSVKLSQNSTIGANAELTYQGPQDVQLKLTVVYADGTKASTKYRFADTPSAGFHNFKINAPDFKIEKKVDHIVVQFVDRAETAGSLRISYIKLWASPYSSGPRAAMALPAPAPAK